MAKAKQKTAKKTVEAKTALESFDNTCPGEVSTAQIVIHIFITRDC